jgi:hypothetical protein
LRVWNARNTIAYVNEVEEALTKLALIPLEEGWLHFPVGASKRMKVNLQLPSLLGAMAGGLFTCSPFQTTLSLANALSMPIEEQQVKHHRRLCEREGYIRLPPRGF